ncbi:uncharacterized protein LOC119787330 isoform X2 [Cyprinodon tularosa]|uniref:uncharacterized protein LOC119787330 isoform X2 n=1 Tax=Cyprinodon tularosa TaxID=77115 RepID=UPI0018E2093E|nr:uncharacterized protein LOC119787330 isoform X2 [Cyprinodon tularosa]
MRGREPLEQLIQKLRGAGEDAGGLMVRALRVETLGAWGEVLHFNAESDSWESGALHQQHGRGGGPSGGQSKRGREPLEQLIQKLRGAGEDAGGLMVRALRGENMGAWGEVLHFNAESDSWESGALHQQHGRGGGPSGGQSKRGREPLEQLIQKLRGAGEDAGGLMVRALRGENMGAWGEVLHFNAESDSWESGALHQQHGRGGGPSGGQSKRGREPLEQLIQKLRGAGEDAGGLMVRALRGENMGAWGEVLHFNAESDSWESGALHQQHGRGGGPSGGQSKRGREPLEQLIQKLRGAGEDAGGLMVRALRGENMGAW